MAAFLIENIMTPYILTEIANGKKHFFFGFVRNIYGLIDKEEMG